MKKFLSMVLTIILTFSMMSASTYSMVTEDSKFDRRSPTPQNVETNLYTVKKLPFVFLFTGITVISSILSGLIGYKIGNDRRVNDEKEITLTGSILAGNSERCNPIGSVSYDRVLLVSSCIDEMFQVDIPKLSKEDTFPARYLSALAYHLDVLSMNLDFDDLPDECRQKGLELHNMAMNIEHYVDKRGKKIQAGYLKTLLRNAQKLATEAGEIYDKIAQKKERKNQQEL